MQCPGHGTGIPLTPHPICSMIVVVVKALVSSAKRGRHCQREVVRALCCGANAFNDALQLGSHAQAESQAVGPQEL
jgi:hypothetical protein